MKKIMFLMILLIPLMVKGETYYSEFYLKEKESNKYIETSDTLKREEKVLYNNYNYIRTNEAYYPIYHNPSTAPFLDSNDEIISNWVSMSYEKNRTTGPYTNFLVRKLKKVHYLMFRSFIAPNAIFKTLKIFYQGKEIKYTIINTNYIFGSIINNQTEFLVKLDDIYDIYGISVETTFTDSTLNRIAYMIKAYSEYIPDITKMESFSNEVIRTNSEEKYTVYFLNDMDFHKFLIESAYWIYPRNYATTTEVNYFTYPLKKYKYYNLTKHILNEYSEEPLFGCYLNYEDSKTIYNYYERYKIELLDEITKKEDIDNLIISSNIPLNEIKIKPYVNINQNGKYNMEVSYKDFFFNHNIEVNIPENNKYTTIKSEQPITKKRLKSINNYQSNKTTMTITSKIIPKPINLKNKIIKNNSKNHYMQNIYLFLLILLIFNLVIIIIFKIKKES